MLLSDGTSPEAWTLARWVKGAPLAVDAILTGAIRTYGADSIITDSAPGASAYSTGYKGTDKAIAIGPYRTTIDAAKTVPSLAYVPLVTVLEAARVKGFATGLIATSNVQHATPAAFSAHVPDRNSYDDIAKQQVYQGMDVVSVWWVRLPPSPN
ncbi:MAG: alkaline phosphatase [Anaeromyxobacter sp.]